MKINYTDFVMRQFKNDFKGTNLSHIDKDFLLDKIREAYNNLSYVLIDPEPGVEGMSKKDESILRAGYMPFCKLLFINNPTNVRTGTVPITISNERYLQSDYISRRPEEKKVLTRYLNIPSCLKHEIPVASYLMVILYSKEQIDSENIKFWETNGGDRPTPFVGEYGIVSINAQMVKYEEPMNPITMMRNALGENEGGSGAPIDNDTYEKSVDFWSRNSIVLYDS